MKRNFTLIELLVIRQILVQIAIPLQMVASQYDKDLKSSGASSEKKREVRSAVLAAIAIKLIKDPTLGEKLVQSSGYVAQTIRTATIDYFRKQRKTSDREATLKEGELDEVATYDMSAEVEFLLRLRMVVAGDTLEYAMAKIEGYTDLEYRKNTGQKATDVSRHRRALKEVLGG